MRELCIQFYLLQAILTYSIAIINELVVGSRGIQLSRFTFAGVNQRQMRQINGMNAI